MEDNLPKVPSPTLVVNENGNGVSSTKERLASIASTFNDFDLEMRRGTRQRREKDEFKITKLKDEMSRLDAELTTEIKRRGEMNKSTQIWFEDELTKLHKSLQVHLQEKKVHTEDRLAKLHQRLIDMNTHFEEGKQYILNYIDETGIALNELLQKFKSEFDEDRKQRLEREEIIVKQLTDHEQYTNTNYQNQTETREKLYSSLKSTLDENIELRDKSDAKFQAYFEKNVSKLRNDYRAESETRQREDDEIVEALNRYTLKLQKSLKVINSTAM